MSRSTRRLALRASIARSRATELSSLSELRQMEQADKQLRIDRLTRSSMQLDLERASRASVIAHAHRTHS